LVVVVAPMIELAAKPTVPLLVTSAESSAMP
jgi:hypothetical protein